MSAPHNSVHCICLTDTSESMSNEKMGSQKNLQYYQLSIFTTLFIGYACYAYNRKSVSFAMPKLIEEGLQKSEAGELHFKKVIVIKEVLMTMSLIIISTQDSLRAVKTWLMRLASSWAEFCRTELVRVSYFRAACS